MKSALANSQSQLKAAARQLLAKLGYKSDKFLAELDKLRSATECRLTLIQCDADIQKVEEFDECSDTNFERMRMYGRGGTRFEPVFNWIKEKSRQGVFTFDTLIYLTDGFGSFPDKPPSYPVLWIMTPQARAEIPFGAVIKMTEKAA